MSSFILHPSSLASNPQSLIPNPSSQVVLSAHVGDLDSVLSVEVFRRAIDDLLEFFEATPDAVACDLHPDYASTQHAEQLAARWGVPLLRVQHHHAHVAACMAEHGLDGAGAGVLLGRHRLWPRRDDLGRRGSLCEGSQFRRVAHLRTFPLPGGDQAMHEPRRSALGLLFEMFGPGAAEHVAGLFRPAELEGLLSMLDQEVHSPRTSSMGRLFDAVAALCGLPPVISFEGQAAMSLEYLADETVEEAYPFAISRASKTPHRRLRRTLYHRLGPDDRRHPGRPRCRRSGVSNQRPIPQRPGRGGRGCAAHVAGTLRVPKAGRTAMRHTDVHATADRADRRVFSKRAAGGPRRARLSAAGFPVYTHRQVPPGDGGISLGQVFVALQQFRQPSHVSGNSR